ncbi:MAG: hypothetical protein M1832_003379 [Thelocarpon impressellum]|nr:MAG: hypothetical protein M1832_003379 [Thelocarpon impressellum]
MPSFFSRSYSQASPVTPPEHESAYSANVRGLQITTGMPYVPHTSVVTTARHEKAAYEGAEHYAHPPPFTSTSMMYHAPAMQAPAYGGLPPPGIAHPTRQYAPLPAQALPPIRVHEHPTFEAPAASRDPRGPAPNPKPEAAKEDKAVGGVAAHLDYEMDQMSDYVSEMAQGMYALYASRICIADIDIIRSVQPSSPVSPAFRKFVSQILSSTRLPSSTILLGLYYLGTRMSMLSASGQHKTSSGQVYRMLTVALLLGSKFLDDNTFQNRSWSEVTGLAVAELNTLEVDWLVAIDWNLHVDPREQHGFMTWKDHWEAWRLKAAERSASALKLLPIDTDVQRTRPQLKTFSPAPIYQPRYPKAAAPVANAERPQPQPHYQQPAIRYDQAGWGYQPSSTDRSPPSAQGTGPNTPEYYGGWTTHGPPAYPVRQHAQYPAHPPSYHPTPYAPPQYSQNIWNSHGAGCGCTYCLRPAEPYLVAAGYAPQTVMG